MPKSDPKSSRASTSSTSPYNRANTTPTASSLDANKNDIRAPPPDEPPDDGTHPPATTTPSSPAPIPLSPTSSSPTCQSTECTRQGAAFSQPAEELVGNASSDLEERTNTVSPLWDHM